VPGGILAIFQGTPASRASVRKATRSEWASDTSWGRLGFAASALIWVGRTGPSKLALALWLWLKFFTVEGRFPAGRSEPPKGCSLAILETRCGRPQESGVSQS
jgi:hypothetical protein